MGGFATVCFWIRASNTGHSANDQVGPKRSGRFGVKDGGKQTFVIEGTDGRPIPKQLDGAPAI